MTMAFRVLLLMIAVVLLSLTVASSEGQNLALVAGLLCLGLAILPVRFRRRRSESACEPPLSSQHL